MKKDGRTKLKLAAFIGILLFLVTGLTAFLLSDIPFGRFFETSMYICIAALGFVFVLTAIMCFRAKGRWLKWLGLVPVLLFVIIVFITMIIIDFRVLYFRSLPPNPTQAEWMEDVQSLADQMAEKHPNIYTHISREKWEESIKEIKERILKLSDSESVMELFRLSGLPNDNHTFPFVMIPCFKLHSFPFVIYGFPEGWHIVKAGREYNDLIGSRILKIGSETIEDIYDKYPIFLAAENESSHKERFSYMVMMSEWLAYHNIIDDIGRAEFTLQKNNNEQIILSVRAIKFYPHFLWSNMYAIDNNAPPVFTNYRRDYYRFELLPDSKTLYIQLNQCDNQPRKETAAAFSKRVESFTRDHEFERCVVDLRNNDGGSPVYDELLRFLRNDERINRHGRLFVLIGRRTSSAAVILVTQLQLQTKAIFIGEPTGQGPIFYSTPSLLELPHSRLVFSVSSRFAVAGMPFDNRNAIFPDIPVDFSIEDFRQGRDPVLEAALGYNQGRKDTPMSLPEDTFDRLTGRYLLTAGQVMDVKKRENSLFVLLTDFIPGSDFRFLSELHPESENIFKTDVPGVTIRFPASLPIHSPHLFLDWMGKEITLERAANETILAFELISQGDIKAGCQSVRQNKKQYMDLFPDLEGILNRMGYLYLRQKDVKASLDLFRLNVDLFPESSNVYDSYGEALMEDGQINLAIENYEKSLELNPDNMNAVKELKTLKKAKPQN